MLYNEGMENERAKDVFPAEKDLTSEYLGSVARRVRALMDERRFSHTLGVAREAEALAGRYGLSAPRAAFAGLLHDCAKRMPYEDMRALAVRKALLDDPRMLSSANALHGFVGAYVARRDFGVTDEEILSAVRWHTFGHPGMTDFEKCLFIADATESDTRVYPGVGDARALSRLSLNAAALLLLLQTRAYVLASGYPYFRASGITIEWLEKLLTTEERALLEPLTARIIQP